MRRSGLALPLAEAERPDGDFPTPDADALSEDVGAVAGAEGGTDILATFSLRASIWLRCWASAVYRSRFCLSRSATAALCLTAYAPAKIAAPNRTTHAIMSE